MCHSHGADEGDLFPLRCDGGIVVSSGWGSGKINMRMHHSHTCRSSRIRDGDPLNDRRPRENALCNTKISLNRLLKGL